MILQGAAHLTLFISALVVSSQALSKSFVIGQGIDATTRQSRQQCLVVESVAPIGGPKGHLTTTLLHQEVDAAVFVEGEASAEVGCNFLGGGAELRLTHERRGSFNLYSFTSVMEVVWDTLILGEFKVSPDAFELLAELPFSYDGHFWKWPKFRDFCGDHFVKSLTNGAKIRIRLDVYHESEHIRTEQVKKVIVKLLWRKKTKESKSESIQNFERFSATLTIDQDGGDLVRFAEHFPNSLTCSQDNLNLCEDYVEKVFAYFENDLPQQRESKIVNILDFKTESYESIPWIYD